MKRLGLLLALASVPFCPMATAQTAEPTATPSPLPAAEEPEPPGPVYPRIVTRGQVQIQWDDGARGAATGDDPAPVLNGIGAFPTDDQIQIRRARVNTTLMLTRDLEIVNETNFDTRSNSVNVLDMYMRARLNEDVNLRAGLFKIPFGWEGLRSSGTTNTIEMSDVTRGLSSFRDSGLAFGYEDKHWQANLAFVQGQGGVWTDSNAAKDVVGKVSYQFSPAWTVGTSFHFGSFRPDGSPVSLPVRRAGVELQYHEAPWKLEAEYLWSDGFNYVSRTDSRARGFYATVVRELDRRNDLVLSFDRFDPDVDRYHRLTPDNFVNRRNRLVLGWNHYFSRKPIHRVMVNYEIYNEEQGPKVSNDGFRIRYQYSW